MPISAVLDIIEDIRRGRMVILMDDEDRENEGDLIIAAEAVTPEIITFFASHACGLICMPITMDRARQLALPLMVRDNRSQHETNFTVSIDAANLQEPGITSAGRAATVLAAVARQATPTDIVQPGHVFPLVAKPGGVLRRAGHTEAGCDLARQRHRLADTERPRRAAYAAAQFAGAFQRDIRLQPRDHRVRGKRLTGPRRGARRY